MITAYRPGSQRRHISLATVSSDTVDTVTGLDFIAVERAVNGEMPDGMTLSEKQAAARILWRRSLGPTEIGRRLHLDTDTVRKWRATDPDAPALKGRPRGGAR